MRDTKEIMEETKRLEQIMAHQIKVSEVEQKFAPSRYWALKWVLEQE